MGWVTLQLRKLSLRTNINGLQLQDLNLSREINGISRHLSYETSLLNAKKAAALKKAKEKLIAKNDERPSVDSANYSTWLAEYNELKSQYDSERVDISDAADDEQSTIEEESKDRQTAKEEEQNVVETQLDASNQELSSIADQISTEIQNTALKFK